MFKLPNRTVRGWLQAQSNFLKIEQWLNLNGLRPGDVVVDLAGDSERPGFFKPEGQTVPRTGKYARVFKRFGTKYGVGDGTTTFQLPDLRNRSLVGAGGSYAVGATGGAATHTLTTAQLPAHNHGAGTLKTFQPVREELQFLTDNHNSYTALGGWGAVSGWTPNRSDALTGNTSNAGSGSAHNNMPPYLAVQWWMKL